MGGLPLTEDDRFLDFCLHRPGRTGSLAYFHSPSEDLSLVLLTTSFLREMHHLLRTLFFCGPTIAQLSLEALHYHHQSMALASRWHLYFSLQLVPFTTGATAVIYTRTHCHKTILRAYIIGLLFLPGREVNSTVSAPLLGPAAGIVFPCRAPPISATVFGDEKVFHDEVEGEKHFDWARKESAKLCSNVDTRYISCGLSPEVSDELLDSFAARELQQYPLSYIQLVEAGLTLSMTIIFLVRAHTTSTAFWKMVPSAYTCP